ncbi:MAG: 16S rRNA (uracil(1498)-N(3))-methyltransferase [Syntrophotaleaceae bacterium]
MLHHDPVLETTTALPPEAVRALSYWSARPGEIVTVTGPDGTLFRARIVNLSSLEALVVPFERWPRTSGIRGRLAVYQALPQKERFELILEKLTELGVDRIAPFTSRRSVTLQQRDAGQKKSHKWPEVVLRAAKQCRRDMLPELAPVLAWTQVLQEIARSDHRMMLYEGRDLPALGEAGAEALGNIALLIGPEGGFSEDEVREARAAGIVPVSLGRRILRTETAAIVATAILQYCLGDLG